MRSPSARRSVLGHRVRISWLAPTTRALVAIAVCVGARATPALANPTPTLDHAGPLLASKDHKEPTGEHMKAPRLLIVEQEPGPLPAPHEGTNLARELSDAVTGAGCVVERICRDPSCKVRRTDEEGLARLTFSSRYEAAKFTCTLAVELQGGAGSFAGYRDLAVNPVCPVSQLIKDTRQAGQRACRELRGAGGPRSASGPLGLHQLTSPGKNLGEIGLRAWLGPSLLVLGSGLAALGLYQAMQHGDLTRCEPGLEGEPVCTHTKKRPLAIPLILLGAGGLGWGIWELSMRPGAIGAEATTLYTMRGTF